VVESVLSGATRLFPLGAIAGDVIGSVLERPGTKITDFALFTPASRLPCSNQTDGRLSFE
jgi:hypothetical protein